MKDFTDDNANQLPMLRRRQADGSRRLPGLRDDDRASGDSLTQADTQAAEVSEVRVVELQRDSRRRAIRVSKLLDGLRGRLLLPQSGRTVLEELQEKKFLTLTHEASKT